MGFQPPVYQQAQTVSFKRARGSLGGHIPRSTRFPRAPARLASPAGLARTRSLAHISSDSNTPVYRNMYMFNAPLQYTVGGTCSTLDRRSPLVTPASLALRQCGVLAARPGPVLQLEGTECAFPQSAGAPSYPPISADEREVKKTCWFWKEYGACSPRVLRASVNV